MSSFSDLWIDWEHGGWRQASRWLSHIPVTCERTVYSGHVAEVSGAETEEAAARRSRSVTGEEKWGTSGRPQGKGATPKRGPHFRSFYPEVSIPASGCRGWRWDSSLRGRAMRSAPPGQRKSPEPLLPLHGEQLKAALQTKDGSSCIKKQEENRTSPSVARTGCGVHSSFLAQHS